MEGSTEQAEVKIYCDGGSRGNPGPAASAIVVYRNHKVIFEKSKYLGIATNNVAEYEALLLALAYLTLNEKVDAQIVLDSLLVTKQMTGEYRVKDLELRKLHSKAKALQKSFSKRITYTWSKREGNKAADRLVNEELDSQLHD